MSGPIDGADDETVTALPVATLPNGEDMEHDMLGSPVLGGFFKDEFQRRKARMSLPR